MIVNTFNLTWWLAIAFAALFGVISSILLNRKELRIRKVFMEKLSIILLVFFVIYKAWIIWFDPNYTTNIWRELPFNLCNFGVLLFYPAIHFDLKRLKAFLFYCGTLGVIMALLMPSKGFYGYPIYTFRTFAYLATHLLIIVMGNMLVSLDLYNPSYNDVIPCAIMLIIYALFAHGLNTLFRVTGLCQEVNYCFTYGQEGNPVTELMMKYIPCPYLYLLPFAVPLALVNSLMCACCKLLKKNHS